MKNFKLNKFNALAAVAALVLSSAALMAQDSAPATNGQRTDGQIEMDVVQALDASQSLKNDLITAATIQTQVTLSGTVASDASKQLAESIVSKVQGVTKVNNHLKVGNPADDQNAQGAPPEPAPDDQAGAPPQNPPQYADQQGNEAPEQPRQPDPRYSQN